jgi:hypothetical protein
MIFLVWLCLVLVYQLECLLYYIRRLCAFVFHFLNFVWPFESWSNPRFDQGLNKFKTWKWKCKHGSFLVTPRAGLPLINMFFLLVIAQRSKIKLNVCFLSRCYLMKCMCTLPPIQFSHVNIWYIVATMTISNDAWIIFVCNHIHNYFWAISFII